YDACAGAIELAIAARELRVGVSGWKGKRAALVERWLTRATHAPGMDTWLSRISAERIEEWAQGHPGERSRLARSVMPKLLEPPDLPDEPLPTLTWMLGHASEGLRLTARHYIAPSLVGEAAVLFGWGPTGATPEQAARRHQELDVYPLHTLRGLAQHEMGAVRRSGSALVLTRTGRLMADDAAVRWHIGTASLIGPDDGPDPDFTVAVREAALLLITLHDSPVGYEELASRLTELHAAEGWASRSGGSLASAIRGEIHVLRHRLRALQLLDEEAPVGSVALTSIAPAAAVTGRLARALRPRRHERGEPRHERGQPRPDRLTDHAHAARRPPAGHPQAHAAPRQGHRHRHLSHAGGRAGDPARLRGHAGDPRGAGSRHHPGRPRHGRPAVGPQAADRPGAARRDRHARRDDPAAPDGQRRLRRHGPRRGVARRLDLREPAAEPARRAGGVPPRPHERHGRPARHGHLPSPG